VKKSFHCAAVADAVHVIVIHAHAVIATMNANAHQKLSKRLKRSKCAVVAIVMTAIVIHAPVVSAMSHANAH